MRELTPGTSPPDDESDAVTRIASIESAFESDISSLSGDSGARDSVAVMSFDNHGIHGRQAERQLLENAFERLQPGAPSEVVVIRGDGGTGKSFLVESLRAKVTDQEDYFALGKFDQVDKAVPYSAICEAFSDLCDLILQDRELEADAGEDGEFDLQLHQNSLLDKVGRDAASVLIRFVNNFAPLVGIDSLTESGQKSWDEAVPRFKTSCMQFLRAVASDERKVCFVLDDLQHADEASLEIIEALIADGNSKNILMICTYQDNDRVRAVFTEHTKGSLLRISTIELQNLDCTATNQLLSVMLDKDEAVTRRLSEVVMAKTHGNVSSVASTASVEYIFHCRVGGGKLVSHENTHNLCLQPYFVKNYLNLLRSEGYLQCVKGMWTWDIGAIASGTSISDNVVDMVESKIKKLHPHVQTVLQIASCLGFQFPRDVLDQYALENLACGDMAYMHQIQEYLTKCLMLATKAGLIEPIGNGKKFKFSHSRVRQRLAELIPTDVEERQIFHESIGNVIWSLSGNGKREWYVLAAAEQLKETGKVEDPDEKMHKQSISLKAAKIARARCAFGPAAEFFEAALALMDEKDWNEQYRTMLTIHCLAAEMNMAAGRFNACQKHADIVFQNAKTSFDKMPAYFVLTQSLGAQCRIDDSFKIGTKGLAVLGEKIPRKPKLGQVLYNLIHTRRLIKGWTDGDLLGMHHLKSREKLAAMRLLSSILTLALFADELTLVAIVSMRMIQISLRHGLSTMTPISLVCWGMFSNQKEAYRFGNLALKMARQMNESSALPMTIAFVHGFTMHREGKLRDALSDLDEGYKIGIGEAQVFPGAVCRTFSLSISLLTGAPLCETERGARSLCSTLREMNQNMNLGNALTLWQVTLNLLGDSQNDNPTVLTGRAMNDNESLVSTAELKKTPFVQFSIYAWTAFLAVYFGNWQRANEFLEKLKPAEKTFPDHFMFYVVKLFEGLASYENFRRSGKRHFLVSGRRKVKLLKALSSSGAKTCKPFYKFLYAEEKATKGNMTVASVAYDKAIEALQGAELLPFEALACERAGTFMFREKMTLLTKRYLARSLQLYKTWGARTKTSRLGRLLQDIPISTRIGMSVLPTVGGARTIPSDANFLAFESHRFGKVASRTETSLSPDFDDNFAEGTMGFQVTPLNNPVDSK